MSLDQAKARKQLARGSGVVRVTLTADLNGFERETWRKLKPTPMRVPMEAFDRMVKALSRPAAPNPRLRAFIHDEPSWNHTHDWSARTRMIDPHETCHCGATRPKRAKGER